MLVLKQLFTIFEVHCSIKAELYRVVYKRWLFICPSVILSFHACNYLSSCISLCPIFSTLLFIFPSANLSICLPVCLSLSISHHICLFVCLHNHFFFHQSVCPLIHPLVHLSNSLSIFLFPFPSVFMSICPFVKITHTD